MLRLMIDHHPEVAFPNESEFLTEFFGPGGTFPSASEYRQRLQDSRVFRSLTLATDDNLDFVAQCQSFLQQYLDAKPGAALVGTTVHNHFDLLPRIWPKARFIHLLRDGRDVARSAIPMGWAGSVYEGADLWLETERTWERTRKQIADDAFLDVRYEELLENPAGVLAQVCEFLGVAYSPEMLRYPETTTYSAPDPKLAYQWRRKQTAKELMFVESKIGDLLVARGYTLSGQPVRPPSTLEALQLKWQGKWHRLLFRIRRNGIWLTVTDFVARKLGLKTWHKRIVRKLDAIEETHLK